MLCLGQRAHPTLRSAFSFRPPTFNYCLRTARFRPHSTYVDYEETIGSRVWNHLKSTGDNNSLDEEELVARPDVKAELEKIVSSPASFYDIIVGIWSKEEQDTKHQKTRNQTRLP
ncbi:Protein of unknown function [Pyronema omphalodes CBS 100304]|uniref:Uncharacterized protein n=1 Tax=Pyronema omphalodes (strain CBS 100304) TaxID=1076935 RepID=U4LDA5_PYROM|nr:Protein of unknown function [Pyronema omphalodes CBS 100304]